MATQYLFFSPLDPSSLQHKETPSLLLQLIFKELISAKEYLIETNAVPSTPFCWCKKPGSKNKIQEYISLLALAFPKLKKETTHIFNNLDKPCTTIGAKLKPFVLQCQKNESLLFFLIKHQNYLNIKSILHTISPKSIDLIKRKVKIQYKKRGFTISKWTP